MAVFNYKPNSCYTLGDEISAGKSIDLSHSNFQFKVNDDGVIHSFDTIYSRYHSALRPYIIEMELSDDDYNKYYQKPKLLSYDLYGTPELWSGILYINNLVSIANFTKRKVKVFRYDILDIIGEIITIYNNDLTNNKKEVYSEE